MREMDATRFLPLLFVLSAAVLHAQSEAVLRDYFEGRYVTVKIDMPATKDGVDVYPLSARPLDLQRYSRSIKASGAALKKDDSVMVTLVKVKDKNIEFQLGGGGFGTLGDDTGDSFHATSIPKTKREKELEQELKGVTDKAKKKSIERELSDLRSERSREESSLRAEAAQAEEARKTRLRQQALGGGSRFNLRFPSGVPAEALTPDGVIRALSEYVEFSFADSSGISSEPGALSSGPRQGNPPASSLAGLRKGMTSGEVAAALGDPESCAERSEGALKVTTCLYRLTESRAECQFVDGVLLRYTIASE
jgi:hypothetical protein